MLLLLLRAAPAGHELMCGPSDAEQLKMVLQSLAGFGIRPIVVPQACAGVGYRVATGEPAVAGEPWQDTAAIEH